jgi:beta-lactamase class A
MYSSLDNRPRDYPRVSASREPSRPKPKSRPPKKKWPYVVLIVLCTLTLSNVLLITHTFLTSPSRGDTSKGTGTPASSERDAWVSNSPAPVVKSPGGSQTIATLYKGFALTATGNVKDAWDEVSWSTYVSHFTGWIAENNLVFTAPSADGEQPADLAALSPDLAQYVNSLQKQEAGVAIYSPDTHRFYGSNADGDFTTASTFKIPILITLLSQIEKQKRQLTADEDLAARQMIQVSSNDAASTLYADINYSIGIQTLMDSLGITGLKIDFDSWGFSTVTPRAMTQLLTAVATGRVLTPADRQYAYSLMSNIDPSEQYGIGETAPQGGGVYFKDGWVQDPDTNIWATNTAGIVTVGQHTYIISVFVAHDDNMDDGWQVVDTICKGIFATLK